MARAYLHGHTARANTSMYTTTLLSRYIGRVLPSDVAQTRAREMTFSDHKLLHIILPGHQTNIRPRRRPSLARWKLQVGSEVHQLGCLERSVCQCNRFAALSEDPAENPL
eukprot:2086698-Pyramimonas_sp.AAC.1